MDLSMDRAMPEEAPKDETTVKDALGGAPRRPRRLLRAALFVVALFAVMLARPASRHVRAAQLLVSFSDANAKPDAAVVNEELFTIDVPEGRWPARSARARLFVPAGVDVRAAPAMVLVHGVHAKGIEEPRLQRFARAVARSGIVALTPEVEELSDYHVAPRSMDTVGAAVRALRSRTGGRKVGVMGMSFGGGVALLTAADPRFAGDVAFVVAVGAHDDLARVSHFFATNEIADPSGAPSGLRAHEYGATVLVYTHVEDFFPEGDVPAARDALRFWLWEEREKARASAARLSPASKEKVEKLFAADLAPVRAELLAEIEKKKEDMKAVSPHGRLGGLRAPVYLLHGAGDTVIPPTETLWLAEDVPPAYLRSVLVSPAIQHVELKEPKIGDEIALVHFMGQVISEAEDTR
jgi:pimeloyl-ACP methyl ester carboxylesterase